MSLQWFWIVRTKYIILHYILYYFIVINCVLFYSIEIEGAICSDMVLCLAQLFFKYIFREHRSSEYHIILHTTCRAINKTKWLNKTTDFYAEENSTHPKKMIIYWSQLNTFCRKSNNRKLYKSTLNMVYKWLVSNFVQLERRILLRYILNNYTFNSSNNVLPMAKSCSGYNRPRKYGNILPIIQLIVYKTEWNKILLIMFH